MDNNSLALMHKLDKALLAKGCTKVAVIMPIPLWLLNKAVHWRRYPILCVLSKPLFMVRYAIGKSLYRSWQCDYCDVVYPWYGIHTVNCYGDCTQCHMPDHRRGPK